MCNARAREVEVEVGWFRRANQRVAPSPISLLALAPLLPMRHTCRIALGTSTIIPWARNARRVFIGNVTRIQQGPVKPT